MIHVQGDPLPSTENTIQVAMSGGQVMKEQHDEIATACVAYCRNQFYTDMSLTEYLSRMFDASNYSREII